MLQSVAIESGSLINSERVSLVQLCQLFVRNLPVQKLHFAFDADVPFTTC